MRANTHSKTNKSQLTCKALCVVTSAFYPRSGNFADTEIYW